MNLYRFITLVIIIQVIDSKEIFTQKEKRDWSKYVGVWSSWSPWSECSRTCGGGVSLQTRSCRAQQLLHHNSDSTLVTSNRNYLRFRQFPISKTQGKCVGVSIRHQLCNPKQCPGKSPSDFLKEQCSSFDDTYKWEPFYQDDSPCALNCKAIGFRFYATLAQKVVDGTPCNFQGSLKKICVGGVCKR